MRERPILMNGAMVRATLNGSKTQTRRIYKNSRHPDFGCEMAASELAQEQQHVIDRACPFGQPGDRLWVRETWAHHVVALSAMRDEDGPFVYAADGDLAKQCRLDDKWTPSIHMPRWASRINLEITGVRVERLQDISAKDILAEGAVLRAQDDQFGHNPVSAFDGKCYMDLKSLWAHGWESINGKGSWRANPWLWVIDFKTVGQE